MNGVETTFILQLIGVASAGAFAGESLRCATCERLQLRLFLASILSEIFLAVLMGYGLYSIAPNKPLTIMTTGLLAYQDPKTLKDFSLKLLEQYISREDGRK